jgi:hypothetical protein
LIQYNKWFTTNLIKTFKELEDNHKAVPGMIDKCSNTAKQFYVKISQEKDLNDGGDSSNDSLQEANDDDAFSVNTSEEITAHQIAV